MSQEISVNLYSYVYFKIINVKDDNKWEKENENKQKMRKVIKHVTHKNSK